jgi:hypothetical protein
LNDFNNLFLIQNNISKGSEKARLKDYISNLDFKTFKLSDNSNLIDSNVRLEKATQPAISVSNYNFNPTNVSEKNRQLYKNYVLEKLGTPELKYNTNSIDFTYPDLKITITKEGGVTYHNMIQKIVDLSKTDTNYDIKFMIGLNKFAEEAIQPATEAVEEQDYLEETSVENMMTFNDQDADVNYYRNLVKQHPDVIYITNPAVTDIQTKFAKPETNQAKFAKLAGEMSITIPTDLRPGDNMKTFPAEKYNDYKAMVERKIADIKTAMQNQQVAFSKAGYGNAYSMPQELFVYLSKRLFEEFGYINPGSAMDNELNNQDIDDTEILESLGFESDPFKC